MYARKYQENEPVPPFHKGEYNIPANYHGNLFSLDGDLQKDIPDDPNKSCLKSVPEAVPQKCEDSQIDAGVIPCPTESEPSAESDRHCESEGKKGLLGRILSRFDKGFSLDDLLIIGLILILLNGDKSKCPENRDEIIILLALLLLGG